MMDFHKMLSKKIGFISLTFFIVFSSTVSAMNSGQDEQEIETLTVRAAQGDAEAQNKLGEIYGAQQDAVKALHYFTLAANQGHASAQLAMGVMYELGEAGLERDPMKAIHYFTLSAHQGDPDAQYSLSKMYKGAEGVAKDPVKTAHYLKLAADQGHAWAQFDINNKGLCND